MSKPITKSGRRLGVVVNYTAIILFLLLFYLGKYHGWNVPVAVAAIVAVVIVLITFIVMHVKTRLWKLIHTRAEKLDEREIQITLESLRRAYSIFAVINLAVLLWIALSAGRNDSMFILIFASLLGATEGYKAIWPVFGASNQLVAALALIVVSSYLVAIKRPKKYTLYPACFMLLTTLAALIYQGVKFFKEGSFLLAGVSVLLIILALVIVYEARHILFNIKTGD